MAEWVQRRLEERIPELEQLERAGLLAGGERRAVIRKVTTLEHKVHRRVLSKENFISYIQYEINFLELLKRRRVRTGYNFKKEEVEYAIVNRVHGLFQRALAKWKGDIQLWLSHVAFCKKWNAKVKLSKVFSAMLAIHSDKPALWIMAAKWEMEDRLSSENARQLFLRALRFHPESQKLYQEYFRMELMHAEKLRKEKELLEMAKLERDDTMPPEEIVSGELARIVYKNAIQKIAGNVEFHLSFWNIAVLFDFSQKLQAEIVTDLQTLYPHQALTWDFVARRELELGAAEAAGPSAERKQKVVDAAELARREQRCCAVYDQAVVSVPTEAMWKCYITFCLERFRRKTNKQSLREKRLQQVLSVFDRAKEASLLPQALYKQWLRLLMESGDGDKAVQVVETACAGFGNSLEMWQSSLEVLMELQNPGVRRLFQEAFQKVSLADSLPLWLLYLKWSESTSSVNETETLYQQALRTSIPAISVTVKENYLDWALRAGGHEKARKVFTSLHENRPFSLEFFKKMIAIEKEQDCSNMQRLREYYERALREFGSTNADLWLEYIMEEQQHPQGKAEHTGQIHWRAMKVLQGAEVERFVSQFTLLQTGHV
ncbi:U3 small nucleolar RNA-associated protein 6 homolog [Pristis pectinata]|uniref:U3 small nucleolar RNA-associated protein 6 homolog n=1 Tax=Pristis pectinata TaxID=685728 RepID=UPI00223D6E8B|nr:U3 small nucleolar RNA-associated protein 6 homolog [Pristis pectinata]